MSYLLDKKIKRKKFLYAGFGVIIFLILFFLRSSVFNGLAYVSHKFFRPFLIFGNKINDKLSSVGVFFVSKNSLYLENQNLKSELNQNKMMLANYNSLLAENISLKEILGRNVQGSALHKMILSAILGKPNQTPYDTLIIDAGAKEGLEIGDTIFAFGNIPIGRISNVYSDSSKVILFSNAGEKTQVVISNNNYFMEAVGRGGGNFEMILPRDSALSKGDQVSLPGIFPYVLGIVATLISDPHDPFIKALLVSPVNIQELKFVEVEKQK